MRIRLRLTKKHPTKAEQRAARKAEVLVNAWLRRHHDAIETALVRYVMTGTFVLPVMDEIKAASRVFPKGQNPNRRERYGR